MGIPACMVHGGGCGAEAKELRHKMYYCTEAGGRANGPVCSPRLSLQMRLKLANSYEDMTITLHTSVILHCIFDYICYMFLSCISSVILHFICYLAFHLLSCISSVILHFIWYLAFLVLACVFPWHASSGPVPRHLY